MRSITIGKDIITEDSPAWICAELGSNHMGSVEMCKKLMFEAKRCGASAVKLQKRSNKTLYTKAFYDKVYDNPNSYGKTYGEHREFLEFDLDQYRELRDYADELGITFFATAFDIPSADFLHCLNMPAYKIASACITDIPLIEHIASFEKPMIISTGGATWEDIVRASDATGWHKCEIALLHCVATYPNTPCQINAHAIPKMQIDYPNEIIGFSDHYNGILASEVAYMMGAKIIEKHFTLNHTFKGTDHALSLEPEGFETLVHNLRRIDHMLEGDGEKRLNDYERPAIEKMGKSIWPKRTLRDGRLIDADDVVIKSPGGGLPPYELDWLRGTIMLGDKSTDAPFPKRCKDE